MLRIRRPIVAVVLAASAGMIGCLFPTDRSEELSVNMSTVPTLILKDSLQLDVQVVDQADMPVPNAVVLFTSDDPTVVTVDPNGLLLAVGVGSTSVNVSAVGYAASTPASSPAVVRGRLEVDSIVPDTVKFGEILEIYGVGLTPDSLFTVTIGGVDADTFAYEPDDPANPERFGKLSVFVPPPAARSSGLTVLGFAGGLVHPDSLAVIQRDLYEFNDTVPALLGPIPIGFQNPALAFETRPRGDLLESADWFRFENAVMQDRTIAVFSENVGSETFTVFVADSLGWSTPLLTHFLGTGSWTIGPQTYLCGGLSITSGGMDVEIEELAFPFSLIALKDLPAGTYDIIVPFVSEGEPKAYELTIVPFYFSVLPADVAEENDYCDVAKDLSVASGQTLTIDNFHDIDWFKFTALGGENLNVTATATPPPGPAILERTPDLDLYLVFDNRPVSLPLVASAKTIGLTETLSVAGLAAGDYFLVVVDFPGVPANYTLSATLAAPGARPFQVPSANAAAEGQGTARRKAGDRRGPRLRLPKGRQR